MGNIKETIFFIYSEFSNVPFTCCSSSCLPSGLTTRLLQLKPKNVRGRKFLLFVAKNFQPT